MAEQQYSNLASSILASAYTAGDTTLTLQTGTGSLFPATGDFTVAIDSPPSFFLYCTARATDVITVNSSASEGTTTGNKPIGTTVTQVITSGVLNNIRSDMNKFGLDADLSTNGMHLGDRYDDTDQSYYYIYGTSGWQQFTSGTGSSGTSGTSGVSGSSGTSALGFTSGTSGISGSSGTSGISGGGGNVNGVGAFASLPISGMNKGDTYKCLDSPYNFIYDGSIWQAFVFGYSVVQPILSAFTQINTGGVASFDNSHGGVLMSIPSQSHSNNVAHLRQALPSGAYYVDSAFTLLSLADDGGVRCGVSDGTKLVFGCFGWESGSMFQLEVQHFNNPTSWSDNQAGTNVTITGPLTWMRMYDDGSTYRTFYLSSDGYFWRQFYQESRTAFLTPTFAVFGMGAYNSSVSAHLLHFSIHT